MLDRVTDLVEKPQVPLSSPYSPVFLAPSTSLSHSLCVGLIPRRTVVGSPSTALHLRLSVARLFSEKEWEIEELFLPCLDNYQPSWLYNQLDFL